MIGYETIASLIAEYESQFNGFIMVTLGSKDAVKKDTIEELKLNGSSRLIKYFNNYLTDLNKNESLIKNNYQIKNIQEILNLLEK